MKRAAWSQSANKKIGFEWTENEEIEQKPWMEEKTIAIN